MDQRQRVLDIVQGATMQHRWSATSPTPRHLVRPVRTDRTGTMGPTPDEARGPGWRRTSRGLYVPTQVDSTLPEQRVMEQAARLPAGGAVTGWAALRLAGANFFDGLQRDGRTSIPVQLAIGSGANIRGDAEASISRESLGAHEVVVRYGVPCTRVERALFDEMRRATDWREAVVAIDMAAAADLTSVRRMQHYTCSRVQWRRSRQVRFALHLASELSRSPNETRLRLVWVLDAGLPQPKVNCEVFDRSGRLVGVADLFDPAAGLVGEYDGADHRSARRQSRDAAREEDFRRLGLEYVKITGPDLRRPPVVVGRVLSSRSRALFLPVAQRAWTLRPPPDWPRADTLDELLDHRAWLATVHAAE